MSAYFDSFKLFLYERISNPLVNAFAFSWIIFNYAFFLICFSSDDVAVKLSMISSYYESLGIFNTPNFFLRGIIYPLASAGLYIFLLPTLSQKIVKYHYEQTTKLKNIKSTAEGETLITGQQAREFIIQREESERQIEDLKSNHKAQLKAYQEERDSNIQISDQLTKSIQEKDSKIKSLEQNINRKDQELFELNDKIKQLQLLVDHVEIEKDSLEKSTEKLKEYLKTAQSKYNSFNEFDTSLQQTTNLFDNLKNFKKTNADTLLKNKNFMNFKVDNLDKKYDQQLNLLKGLKDYHNKNK